MGLLTKLGLRRTRIWDRPTILDEFLDSPLHAVVFRLYLLFLWLRRTPVKPPRNRLPIRVVCISDTHDAIVPHVPNGDLLIFAGDASDDGSAAAIQAQINWLDSLPHQHKVFVCGNHDRWFDIKVRNENDAHQGVDLRDVRYLQRKSIPLTFNCGRRLNIYGAGDVPGSGSSNSAFKYMRDEHPWENLIPRDTDILITHTPPRHHLDLSLGCDGLLQEVWRVKPTLHVFGHVHWGRGVQPVFWDDCQRSWEQLMSRNGRGPIWDMFPNASWFDAFKVLFYGVKSIVWHYVMLGGASSGGLMVNAAMQHGNTGELTNNPPIVIEM